MNPEEFVEFVESIEKADVPEDRYIDAQSYFHAAYIGIKNPRNYPPKHDATMVSGYELGQEISKALSE